MAWSHMVCLGSRWDFSSLKTLLCLMYSSRIFVLSTSWAVPMVALQSRSRSRLRGRGLLMVRGRNCAFVASDVLNMMGSCVWSIHPLLQLILGCTATNRSEEHTSEL